MNLGTKIRTIIAIIVIINTILMIFDVFNFNIYYKITSTIIMIAAWGFSHYFNNDFSEEATEQTGYTRLCKEAKKIIVGENFFDEVDDFELEDGE